MRLEAAGWKGRQSTAIQQSPRLTDFYRSLTRRFAETGGLEWHQLKVDGRTIAMEMSFRFGSAVVTPKAAYDEGYSDCAPGNLLFEDSLRHGLSRQDIEELNDVSEAAWQTRWKMKQHAYYKLHILPCRTLPILIRLPYILGDRLMRKHLRPLMPEAVMRHYVRLKQRKAMR
jgi:hypothetical protein